MRFQSGIRKISCITENVVRKGTYGAVFNRTMNPQWSIPNQSFKKIFLESQSFNICTTTRNLSTPQSAASNEINPDNNSDTSSSIVWTTHRLNKDQITKVDAIFQKILWLDMFETSMLTELVNERLGRVKLSPKQRKMLERQMDAHISGRGMGGGNSSLTAGDESIETDVAPKQILVDVKLIGYDEKSKIKVIKEVRSIVDGLGLKEAKELVEGIPKTIHKGLKPEIAQEFKEKLEAVGAKIEIVSSS